MDGPPSVSPPRTTSCSRAAALGLIAFGWCASGVRAQDTSGALTGSVVDSTAMAPLEDAAVFLWDTPHRGTTGPDGTFFLGDIPPGRYTLVFFHARLGELGVSAGPLKVEVLAGDTVHVSMAIPSIHTILASGCALEVGRDGIVVGRARDGTTGTPLPGVRVRFTWLDDGGGSQSVRELRTDGDGWYQVCDLPSNRLLAVTSDFLGRESFRHEIRVSSTPTYLDLSLEELTLTDVEGRLVDAGSGEGVDDATVRLVGTGFSAVTDGEGRFRFRDLLPGHYTLRAGHLAYGTREDPLDLGSGLRVHLEMQLSHQPVELPPLVVTVEAEDVPQRAMGGTILTSAMLDEVRGHSRDVLDLLRNRNIPGLVVRRQGGRVCVGFITGQVRIMNRGGGCVPALVFIDNVRAADPNLAVDVPADVVDRIVLYRPIEAGNLFGLGGGNGVLMIFTKRR